MPDGAAGQGTPTSGRHSPPEAGGVAYRRTPGWFPSRRCPHPARWRSRARPRFRSISIAPLAPLCGAVPTRGRRSLACASLRLLAWASCAMFSVRVALSATRRALPTMRNTGQLGHTAPSLARQLQGRPPGHGPGRILQCARRQHHEPLPVDLPERHAPARLLQFDQRLARLLDLHLQRRQGLDPGLDARRQPVRQRPAPAAEREKKAQADHQGPQAGVQQQYAHPCDRRRRIGLDGTQRVVRDGARPARARRRRVRRRDSRPPHGPSRCRNRGTQGASVSSPSGQPLRGFGDVLPRASWTIALSGGTWFAALRAACRPEVGVPLPAGRLR